MKVLHVKCVERQNVILTVNDKDFSRSRSNRRTLCDRTHEKCTVAPLVGESCAGVPAPANTS